MSGIKSNASPFNFQTRFVYMHVYVHSHRSAAVIFLANILYVHSVNIMKSLKSFQEETGNEGWMDGWMGSLNYSTDVYHSFMCLAKNTKSYSINIALLQNKMNLARQLGRLRIGLTTKSHTAALPASNSRSFSLIKYSASFKDRDAEGTRARNCSPKKKKEEEEEDRRKTPPRASDDCC